MPSPRSGRTDRFLSGNVGLHERLGPVCRQEQMEVVEQELPCRVGRQRRRRRLDEQAFLRDDQVELLGLDDAVAGWLEKTELHAVVLASLDPHYIELLRIRV